MLKRCNQALLGVVLVWSVVLLQTFATDETIIAPPRLANGVEITGTVEDVSNEGITVRDAKGVTVYPWKHLSAGTRYRYERMLQEKKTKSKADDEKGKNVGKKDDTKETVSSNTNTTISSQKK